MSSKREFERTPSIQSTNTNERPSKEYEIMCEDNAVRMGIMVDRDFTFIRSRPSEVEPGEDEHVWLFVPARTSKRSIERLADSCGSRLVRFFVTVRCLAKYIYSDKFDVAYHLNADGRFFTLQRGTLAELQIQIISPEQNPAVLEFVRAQRIVPHVPSAAPDA